MSRLTRWATTTAVLALMTVMSPSVAAGALWSIPLPMPLDTRDDQGYSASLDALGEIHAAAGEPLAGPGLRLETPTVVDTICCTHGTRYNFQSAMATHVKSGHALIRIAWIDPDRRDAIWLTRNDGGSWTTSRLWVGTARDVSVTNLHRGIAVAFRDGSHRLRYLDWDPVTGPTAAEVVAAHCCSGAPSIAVHGGHPSIAYSRTASHGGRLVLATQGSGWTAALVTTTASRDPSMAFAADGSTDIIYGTAGNGVFLARRAAGPWHRTQIFSSRYGSPAIAADSTGAVVAVAARSNGRRIVERGLAPLSPVVTVGTAPGGDERASQPFVGLHAGLAMVTYAFTCDGCSGNAIYETHQ
jgi:hypothetical protein